MSALLITAYAIAYNVHALFRGRTVSMHVFFKGCASFANKIKSTRDIAKQNTVCEFDIGRHTFIFIYFFTVQPLVNYKLKNTASKVNTSNTYSCGI